MRPSFVHGPVNPLFEDPLVYVNFVYEKRAVLFDLGDFHGLTNRQINRVSHVFVSHLHIDHFVGFDRFLRVRLSTEEPFTLVGPPGITEAVEGHLRGYTWNLIEEYPCRFFVLETDTDWAVLSGFSARESFRRVDIKKWQLQEGRVVEEGSFSVRAVLLEHGTECLGYRLEEPCHVNIIKERLVKLGLRVGPWLGRFKEMVRRGDLEEWIDTGRGRFRVLDLLEIVRITEGQSLCYIVDVSPKKENIERIVSFVKGAQTLYIEAFFLSEDMDRARERNHLTASVAGEIAKRAQVKDVCPLHLSVRYRHCPERVLEELTKASGRVNLRY